MKPAAGDNESNLTLAIQLSSRAAVAATISVMSAQLLHLEFPLYALVAAVIVTDLSSAKTRELGLPRMIGTALGAAMGATFSPLIPNGPLAVGFSVLAAIFLSHLLRLQDAAKVAGYVSGIVVLNHNERPWTYATYRMMETILGIAAALLVSLVPLLLTSGRNRDDV